MNNSSSVDLTAVLDLLHRGFYIFPLHNPTKDGCSCSKPGCSSVGKHPHVLNWTRKASNDPAIIKSWWSLWSQANVGVATGEKSSVIVLDIDDKHAESGSKSLRKLEEKYGHLPSTLTATTGNGKHIYFQHPGIPIKNSAGKLGDGLDIRGDGGYVVCPPSKHANGRHYQWADKNAEIAAAPDWLLDLLTVEDVPSIPEGKRTNTLYTEICSLFRSGIPEADVLQTALATNISRCQPPLSEDKVRGIVARIALTNRPATAKTSARSPLRWFQFDVTDFLSDINVQTLTDRQLGWRTRLNALAWTHRGRLPNDPTKLAKLANAGSPATFKREMLTALFDYDQVEEKRSPHSR